MELAKPEYLYEWTFVRLPCYVWSVMILSVFAEKTGQRTGSLEKIGPSGTFFTMKELYFCRAGQTNSDQVGFRRRGRFDGMGSVHGMDTDADKQPLEIVRHDDGLGLCSSLHSTRNRRCRPVTRLVARLYSYATKIAIRTAT